MGMDAPGLLAAPRPPLRGAPPTSQDGGARRDQCSEYLWRMVLGMSSWLRDAGGFLLQVKPNSWTRSSRGKALACWPRVPPPRPPPPASGASIILAGGRGSRSEFKRLTHTLALLSDFRLSAINLPPFAICPWHHFHRLQIIVDNSIFPQLNHCSTVGRTCRFFQPFWKYFLYQ